MKLEKALQTALSAMPESSSLTGLECPPTPERTRTPMETAKAPPAAASPMKFSPRKAPSPNMIAAVAPSDAPEEMPKMYGSASGFFTIACMMTPQTESPMPVSTASTMRGRRSSQMMS